MSTSLDLGGGLMPSAQLESLLSQMVQGDPEQIRQAEEALTPALSTPAFMLDLLTRLTQSQAAHVRQLAAVLLRRRIGSHWRKLGAANTNRIKATLLQVLATEPEGAPRASLCELEPAPAAHSTSPFTVLASPPTRRRRALRGGSVRLCRPARDVQGRLAGASLLCARGLSLAHHGAPAGGDDPHRIAPRVGRGDRAPPPSLRPAQGPARRSAARRPGPRLAHQTPAAAPSRPSDSGTRAPASWTSPEARSRRCRRGRPPSARSRKRPPSGRHGSEWHVRDTCPRRVPQDAASLLRPLVPLVLGLGARALGESDSLGDDETITLVCSLMDDLLEQAASTPPAHPPTPPPRAATHLARSPPHPALYPPAPAALTPSHPDAPPYRTAPSSRPR